MRARRSEPPWPCSGDEVGTGNDLERGGEIPVLESLSARADELEAAVAVVKRGLGSVQRGVDAGALVLGFPSREGEKARRHRFTCLLLPELDPNGERIGSIRTALSELALRKGEVIPYLFDFGDEW